MIQVFSDVASTLRAGAGAPKHMSDIRGRIVMTGVGIDKDIAGTLDSNYYKWQGVRGGIERTAVCVGNGQLDQTKPTTTARTLNCMYDQQCVMEIYKCTYSDLEKYLQGVNINEKRNLAMILMQP